MGFASIDADGWQAVYTGVPAGPLILSDVSVARAGFNSAGEAVTHAETLKLTKRIRLPYPNQGTLTADKVALSEFVYATDAVAGVTNNSAVVSPKPVAKWVSLDRAIVGDSLAPELVAFHRDGIACVEFRATDGTTTATAKVSAPVVLGAATDRNAVIGYRAVLDISALANVTNIVVHAKVWPRLGGTAAVLDSADGATRREFSARYYRRHVGAVPNYAYVSVAGNDATGVVSATAAAAKASPFATVGAAAIAINALQGPIDGAVIRFMAGKHILANPASARTQSLAAVTLTRDPEATRAEVILQLGGPSLGFHMMLNSGLDPRLNVGCYRIEGVSLVRAGSSWAFGAASGRWNEVQMVSCAVDMANVASAMGNRTNFYYQGSDISGVHGSSTPSGASMTHNLWRGCSGDCGGGATMDAYLMVGCHFTNILRMVSGGAHTGDGQVVAFNRFQIPGTTGSNFSIQSVNTTTTGYVFAQNLIEALPNTAFPAFQPSADGSNMNTDHVIIINNTFTGFGGAGRSNLLYNETAGLNRSHVRHRVAGNIHCQLNVKHDIFATDGTHTGGWSHLYGVGCDGEFSMFKDAGTFIQEYPGAGANIGISATVPNDPLFVNYQAATSGGAGAGGGEYQLRVGSPAVGRTSREWLPFDLGGKLRTRRVSGALESVAPAAAALLPRKAAHILRSDGRLSVRVSVKASSGLCPVRDDGVGVAPAQMLRRGAGGRVLRVDGDARTVWAGRD